MRKMVIFWFFTLDKWYKLCYIVFVPNAQIQGICPEKGEPNEENPMCTACANNGMCNNACQLCEVGK